jgi:rhodanese-related sulfurtransferase
LVHCAAGYRSTIACSLLKMNGYTNVINLIGGVGALEKCAEKFKQPLVVSQD